MVMPASRMLSAISFGVFCRSAPSTSAIMRSRKDEPGDDVMRTTIQSDSTVVPPVTAERSPPASRMTGADSPVMAASLTEATPSMMSPSPGMRSPARPARRVAGTQVERRDGLDTARGSSDRRAAWRSASVRVRRRASACARAAPLGDGLGEVGEQHREPQPGGDLPAERRRLPGERGRARTAR